MSDEWEGADADVIASELARCVLGGRGPRRPELWMGWRGDVARTVVALRRIGARRKVWRR